MALRCDVSLARINPVCEDFEDAWIAHRDGSCPRPRIADYLSGFEGRDSQLLFEHLLELEIDYRRNQGETASIDEYLVAFAQMQSIVHRVFQPIATSTVNIGLDSSHADHRNTAISKFSPGDRIGGYELIETLGKGGMGVVFKALQIALGRIVALKMIKPGETDDPQFVQRFQAEAEAAARLDHIGIVPVFDVGQDGDQYYFSMALVEGQSLADRLRSGPLDSRESAEICRQIAEAMHYAHENHVLHRDLKPANVLLDHFGRAKVTDFGLAKSIHSDSDVTATGQVIGTPSYMPPEQARASSGQVGTTADIYAIGAILYHLLCGRPPFQAATAYEVLFQVINDEPIALRRFNANIDRDLETICAKCLEKDPARRYQSSSLLAEDLANYLEGRPIAARPIGRLGRVWKWCRRKPLVASLSAAFLFSLISGVVVASYFAVRANQNAQRDRQQSEFILNVLQRVFLDISQRLEEIPAAQNARREILKQGLTGLESLSTQLQSDDRSKINQMAIYTQMAEICRILGDESGLNGSKRAIEFTTSATQLGNEIIAHGNPPWETLSKVADAFDGLGKALLETGRYQECKSILRSAVDVRTRLQQRMPLSMEIQTIQLHESKLATSYSAYGDYFAKVEEFDEALQMYELSRQIYQTLFESNPSELIIRNYADVHQSIGDVYVDSDRATQCFPDYHRALELSRRLVEQNPSAENRWSLACAWERIGEYYFYTNELDQALAAYQQSLAESLPKAELEPDNIRTQLGLAIAYIKIGKTYLRLKRPDETISAYQSALEIREPIAAADRHDPETHRVIVNSYQAIAAAYELQQDYVAAEKAYRSALAVYDRGLPEVRQHIQSYIDQVRADLERIQVENTLLDSTQ